MSDLPQAQYQAPVPPPPPPAKKGMNPWLLCGIITCGILLVIAVVVGIFTMRMAGSMIKASKEVTETDLATIQAAAVQVDGATLVQSSSNYEGKWLELNDTIAMASNEQPQTGMGQGSVLILGSGLMLQDISASNTAQAGDQIRAWGQVAEFNFPGAEQTNEVKPFMFIAKRVEVVTVEAPVIEELPADPVAP